MYFNNSINASQLTLESEYSIKLIQLLHNIYWGSLNDTRLGDYGTLFSQFYYIFTFHNNYSMDFE